MRGRVLPFVAGALFPLWARSGKQPRARQPPPAPTFMPKVWPSAFGGHYAVLYGRYCGVRSHRSPFSSTLTRISLTGWTGTAICRASLLPLIREAARISAGLSQPYSGLHIHHSVSDYLTYTVPAVPANPVTIVISGIRASVARSAQRQWRGPSRERDGCGYWRTIPERIPGSGGRLSAHAAHICDQ